MALSPKQVSAAIAAVVVSDIPNGEYLRATDHNANISADQIDLAEKVLVQYNNRPTISGSIAGLSGVASEVVPVEISFLKLADFDDDSEDTDILIDDLVGYARTMFDKISSLTSGAQSATSYTIEQDSTIKIYDKTMSGVKLSFDIITPRGLCQ